MPKLSGEAYTDYWQKRMAIGPDEASFNGRDADRQGEDIWRFISPWLTWIDPRSVLDFGCGYGRMLRRLHGTWPKAKFYGVDLCQQALDSIAHDTNWFQCGKPKLSNRIPKGLAVDLVFDCLALQHVTDESVFLETIAAFHSLLATGGHLVLFENIAAPQAGHVRDMSAKDYMRLWPDLKWQERGVLMLGFQGHSLMVGTK